jgi:hypothetical protein
LLSYFFAIGIVVSLLLTFRALDRSGEELRRTEGVRAISSRVLRDAAHFRERLDGYRLRDAHFGVEVRACRVNVRRSGADPHADTPQPIAVTIPSRNFFRQGFPSSAINFGDQFGKRVYRESVNFKSAHNDVFGSDFVGPRADSEAYFFYPPGLQPGDLVNPGPGPLIGVVGDDSQVYGNGGGGGSRHVL